MPERSFVATILTCSTCAADCGACPPPPPSCGDNACNGAETCSTCAADCGACPPPPPSCGDNVCSGAETCSTCATDCGGCPVARDPVPNTAVCEPVAHFGATITALEDRVLLLVNQRRAAGATCGGTAYGSVPALRMVPELRCAARLHSLDMDTQDYFSHTSLDGRSPWTRMADAGYTGFPSAENIAAGQQTADAVVSAWMASAGHCVNIMGAGYTDMGVGFSNAYWTQVFGR